jgi:hypothetical protein
VNKLVAGLAGIAVFTAAALAAVWFLTSRDAKVPESAPAAAEAPPPAPAPAPAATGIPPSAFLGPQTPPLPPPPAPPNVYGAPRYEPPRGSWEAVPVVARPSALGPLGGAIGRGLNELQPKLAACFDEDTQARFGREGYTRARDAETMDEQGTTVLVLQIETGRDEAHVVDAPVETRGRASDGLIACAQRVLRGQQFSAPGVKVAAGQRFRMLHSLTP